MDKGFRPLEIREIKEKELPRYQKEGWKILSINNAGREVIYTVYR